MPRRSIAKRVGVPLSTVQREVQQLEQGGLVASERVGNTRLAYANEESPYFEELESIVLKAFGPTTLLAQLLRDIPGIEKAHIYGSWARRYLGEDVGSPRDVDVLVIGDPDTNSVYAAARRAERELNMEVNPLIISLTEWANPRGVIKRIKSGPRVALELASGG